MKALEKGFELERNELWRDCIWHRRWTDKQPHF
jgi:hypothetical protein